MNKKEEARLNMFDAVSEVLDNYQTVVDTIPALQESQERLNAKLAEVKLLIGQEGAQIDGIAKDKEKLRNELCVAAIEIIKPISAYGNSISNNELIAKVRYSLSDLQRIPDEKIGPKCTEFIEIATSIAPKLVAYGVNATKLTNFTTRNDTYIQIISKPRVAITNRKTLLTNLKKGIGDIDKLLKNEMDNTVLVLKSSNETFVTQYKNNRKLVNDGVRHTNLKVMVQRADGSAVANIKVIIVELDIEALTDKDGMAAFPKLSPGSYNVKIPRIPPPDLDQAVTLEKGKTLTINFILPS